MSFLSGIFGSKAVSEAVGEIGSVVDNLSTSDDEKATAKNQLTKIVNDALVKATEAQAEVLKADLTGSKLQRNWRPIAALTFVFIIFCTYLVLPLFNAYFHSEDISYLIEDLKTNEHFWTLLEIMIGGYTIGRSVEKVGEMVTRNIDLSQLRKKDRKEAIK